MANFVYGRRETQGLAVRLLLVWVVVISLGMGCRSGTSRSRESVDSAARPLIERARECVIAKGEGAGPVVWTSAVARRQPDRSMTWTVQFPGATAVKVDLTAQTCDGLKVGVQPVPANVASDLNALLRLAQGCAADAGHGVGGTPLLLEEVVLHWNYARGKEQIVASFPEQANGLPSGRDLIVDPATGLCATGIMD